MDIQPARGSASLAANTKQNLNGNDSKRRRSMSTQSGHVDLKSNDTDAKTKITNSKTSSISIESFSMNPQQVAESYPEKFMTPRHSHSTRQIPGMPVTPQSASIKVIEDNKERKTQNIGIANSNERLKWGQNKGFEDVSSSIANIGLVTPSSHHDASTRSLRTDSDDSEASPTESASERDPNLVKSQEKLVNVTFKTDSCEVKKNETQTSNHSVTLSDSSISSNDIPIPSSVIASKGALLPLSYSSKNTTTTFKWNKSKVYAPSSCIPTRSSYSCSNPSSNSLFSVESSPLKNLALTRSKNERIDLSLVKADISGSSDSDKDTIQSCSPPDDSTPKFTPKIFPIQQDSSASQSVSANTTISSRKIAISTKYQNCKLPASIPEETATNSGRKSWQSNNDNNYSVENSSQLRRFSRHRSSRYPPSSYLSTFPVANSNVKRHMYRLNTTRLQAQSNPENGDAGSAEGKINKMLYTSFTLGSLKKSQDKLKTSGETTDKHVEKNDENLLSFGNAAKESKKIFNEGELDLSEIKRRVLKSQKIFQNVVKSLDRRDCSNTSSLQTKASSLSSSSYSDGSDSNSSASFTSSLSKQLNHSKYPMFDTDESGAAVVRTTTTHQQPASGTSTIETIKSKQLSLNKRLLIPVKKLTMQNNFYKTQQILKNRKIEYSSTPNNIGKYYYYYYYYNDASSESEDSDIEMLPSLKRKSSASNKSSVSSSSSGQQIGLGVKTPFLDVQGATPSSSSHRFIPDRKKLIQSYINQAVTINSPSSLPNRRKRKRRKESVHPSISSVPTPSSVMDSNKYPIYSKQSNGMDSDATISDSELVEEENTNSSSYPETKATNRTSSSTKTISDLKEKTEKIHNHNRTRRATSIPVSKPHTQASYETRKQKSLENLNTHFVSKDSEDISACSKAQLSSSSLSSISPIEDTRSKEVECISNLLALKGGQWNF